MSLGHFPEKANLLRGEVLRFVLGKHASKKLQRHFGISQKTAELWLASRVPAAREGAILAWYATLISEDMVRRAALWRDVLAARLESAGDNADGEMLLRAAVPEATAVALGFSLLLVGGQAQ